MNVIRGTQHESNIDAEILYTSYTWYFRHWSLLYNHYNKSVKSPDFDITGSPGCQCRLKFNPKGTSCVEPNSERERAVLGVEFLNKIEFCTLQITVSFIDENMTKLSTYKTIYQNSLTSPITLKFHKSLTELEVSNYLRNDVLTLFFELHIVEAIVESPISTNSLISNFNNVMREEIKDLHDTKDLCDVFFFFKDTNKTLSAHKLVLAANSQVFKAMFTNNMLEQTEGAVDIVGICDAVFDVFLSYMYTGKVNEIEKVVDKLIIVADRYEVVDLMSLCERYMATHLNDNNAIEYLLIAHKISSLFLERKAIEFIKCNTHILAESIDHNLFTEFPSLIKQVFIK